MEEAKEYGDLSNEELLEFLNTLENDDAQLLEAESKAKAEEEANDIDVIPPLNLEFEASLPPEDRRDFWNFTTEEHRRKSLTMAQERQLLKTKLQRAAFDQSDLPLSDLIGKDEVKELITRLTTKERECVARFEYWINLRATRILSPLIPRYLRIAYHKYKQSVLACPGFMYTTEKDKYGEQKTFYIRPNIPYYFEQGTEKDHMPYNTDWGRPKLDKNIFSYYAHKEKLASQEINIASAMWNYNIKTCLDLLKYNVRWFATFYEMRTGKVLLLDK